MYIEPNNTHCILYIHIYILCVLETEREERKKGERERERRVYMYMKFLNYTEANNGDSKYFTNRKTFYLPSLIISLFVYT